MFDIYTGGEIVEYDLSPIPGKTISRREYGRETGTTLEELKARVSGMFDLDQWKHFTEVNFRSFPRYVRDQCMEAKKYFKINVIDKEIFNASLEYCLENDTVSFSNLNDTYNYFNREKERGDLRIHPLAPGYHGGHEPLNVTRRNLSVYKQLMNGGVNESL